MILHRLPRNKQSTEALQFAGFMFVSVEKPPNTVPHVGTLGGIIGISSFGTQADSEDPSLFKHRAAYCHETTKKRAAAKSWLQGG